MREKLRQYGPLPSTGCFITAVAEISDSKALLESTPENSIGVLGRTITGMFCDYFFGYAGDVRAYEKDVLLKR